MIYISDTTPEHIRTYIDGWLENEGRPLLVPGFGWDRQLRIEQSLQANWPDSNYIFILEVNESDELELDIVINVLDNKGLLDFMQKSMDDMRVAMNSLVQMASEAVEKLQVKAKE